MTKNTKMQWQKLLSDKRLGVDEYVSSSYRGVRTDFEHDYDRMVFSSPFRRLQNKTQVFPLPGNVFVHNRLTHSLEVSCVGRSLGSIVSRALRKRHGEEIFSQDGTISSIVSAACLAHDMGNPPFGHGGERVIGAYFSEGNGMKWREKVEAEGSRWSDFTSFEGNANAFRLLTHQFKGRRKGGFALTYSTLASIIKYPYSSTLAGEHGKFGFFQSEESTMREIAEHLGLVKVQDNPLQYCRYPLVYLVEAADDICYQIMDLEDAYKLKIIGFSEAINLLLNFFEPQMQEHHDRIISLIGDQNEKVAYLRSKVINILAENCAEVFIENEDLILDGEFAGTLIGHMPRRQREAYSDCSKVAYQKIYPARDVLDVDLAGHQIFSALLDKLLEALTHPEHLYSKSLLSRVSSQYDTHQETTYGKIQCALDYISGMTDIYALDMYRKITGMSLPAI